MKRRRRKMGKNMGKNNKKEKKSHRVRGSKKMDEDKKKAKRKSG